MGAEGRKQKRTAEYIRRDPIGEYSPLPVFASDQIGGWFVVDSSEYIPRSLSTLCERRSRSDKWSALETPRPLFRVSPSPCGFFDSVFCAARDTLVTNVSRRCLLIKHSRRRSRQCIATYRATRHTRREVCEIRKLNNFRDTTFHNVAKEFPFF